jgi:hypothetical protein
MVLLHEAISGRADVLILGQKKLNTSHEEILLFCDLNSIYSDIDFKLWNIKENTIFFDIPKFQKNQVSQLLVHATASCMTCTPMYNLGMCITVCTYYRHVCTYVQYVCVYTNIQ